MKKFPKTLYIKVEGRVGEEYFEPHQAIDTMADAGETVKVAIYELKQVVEATGSVTVVKIKPVRKRAA